MGRTIQKPWVCFNDPKPWTHGTQVPVRIVLHSTESGSSGVSAIQGVFNFWHTEEVSPGVLAEYGAHFIVDRAGRVGEGAAPTEEQWHVGNFNGGSIGIEQIGYAAWTTARWRLRPLQIIKVARLLAYLHDKYKIPLNHMTTDEIKAGGSGVCRHLDVGVAGVDTSGHTDPGTNYPLATVLWLANRYVRLGGWSKTQPI